MIATAVTIRKGGRTNGRITAAAPRLAPAPAWAPTLARPRRRSRRIAAQERRALEVLVEAVIERAADVEDLMVGTNHREPAHQRVEARCLGGVEAIVFEIGLVDHLADPPEDGIVELVAAKDGLERAAPLVMGQLGTADVERRRVRGNLVRVADK